jgi:hypothetical protein
MLGSMLILALILNYNLFDNYFADTPVFLWATIVTFLILIPIFIVYGVIAISLRNRFPDDAQTVKRLSICISVFVLMSAVTIPLRNGSFFKLSIFRRGLYQLLPGNNCDEYFFNFSE